MTSIIFFYSLGVGAVCIAATKTDDDRCPRSKKAHTGFKKQFKATI